MEIPEFDTIRTIEEINFNQSGQQLSYKQYMGALSATAQRVDKSKIIRETRPRRSARNVYLHDIDEHDDVFIDAEEILDNYEYNSDYNTENNYDINTTIFEISKVSSNPKACLPSQVWYGLSPTGRRTWDTLTDEDKIALIGNLTDCKQNYQQRKPPFSKARNTPSLQENYFPKPITTQQANVHESSLSDMERFQDAFHAFCTNNTEINETDMNISDRQSNDPEELHAFMAQKPPKKIKNIYDRQKKSPGNISRLLSPPQLNSDTI